MGTAALHAKVVLLPPRKPRVFDGQLSEDLRKVSDATPTTCVFDGGKLLDGNFGLCFEVCGDPAVFLDESFAEGDIDGCHGSALSVHTSSPCGPEGRATL